MADINNPSTIQAQRGDNQLVSLSLSVAFPNGSTTDVSSYIKRARIENTPVTATMTVFRFILNLPPSVVLQIQEYSSQVTFHLKATYSSLGSGTTATNANLFDPIVLKPLLMNKDIIPTQDLLGPSNASRHFRYEFAAVPDSALATNKIVVSGCYRDVTMAEVLASLLGKTGKALYIDQPDNKVKYDQVPLLPGNIVNNIYYLQNVYGIYNDTINVYNYYNRIIVSPSKFNSILGSGSVSVTVTFVDNTKSSPGLTKSTMYVTGSTTSGAYSKNIIVDSSQVGYTDRIELNQELFGNDLIYASDRIDGTRIDEVKLKRPLLSSRGFFDKNLTVIDRFGNQASRTIMEDVIVNTPRITLSLDEIAIDQLDVFRLFKIKFDSETHKKAEGIYRVESLVQTYSAEKMKEGTNSSSFNSTLVLRKVRDLVS